MTDKKPPLPGSNEPIRRKKPRSTTSQLERAKKRAAAAKRSLTHAQKKIDSLKKVDAAITGTGPSVVVETDLEELLPTSRLEIEEDKVVFRPNPGPQTLFLASMERECLYGGAAGGGKSYAMLVDPLRYCHIGAHRAIIFRRTNDQLRELVLKSKELYPLAFPGAKWSEQKSTWTFPSGATIWFTYLDRDDDVFRYQGQAFNYVGFDELTHWPTPYPWDYMRSRLRTTHPDLPLFMRATTNPGGPGSWWVRKMFIDPAPWGQAFGARDIETGELLTYGKSDPRHGQPLFMRRFIPAKLSDNPHLYEGGQYEANLLSLPEAQRRQLLEGDWDVCEGAAFPEFNRSIHVCEPFEIPRSWVKFRAADWGYSSPACVLWFAVDFDQNLYVYRELYVKGVNAPDFARMVVEREQGEDISYGILDSSVWAKRGETGPSIAEQMILQGCRWRPADRSAGSRVSGKLEVHRRLQVDPVLDKPRLHIFKNCINLIRTLPTLPLDKHNTEDVDTSAEDHAYDALRYGVMSRPMNRGGISDDFGGRNFFANSTISDPVFGY